MNINTLAKIASIGGMALGMLGSALSGWSQNKIMMETIKKEVAKAVTKQ